MRALALGPQLLLLDEPAAGMNDYETAELGDAVRRIRDRSNCALFVIDHDLHFILNLCDRICVMDLGEVVAIGTPEAIRNDPKDGRDLSRAKQLKRERKREET